MKNMKKKDPNIDVIWFGKDGLLVLLYLVVISINMWGILNQQDWVVAYFAPGVCLIICWAVFARYCVEVYHFMKKQQENMK